MASIFVTCLALFLAELVRVGSAFNCYSCSYVLSTDPSEGYVCVTRPWNVTTGQQTISCTAPRWCSTIVTFNAEMKQIRSVARSCLPADQTCSGDRCCNRDGQIPACRYQCREDLCNNGNAEDANNWTSAAGKPCQLWMPLIVGALTVHRSFLVISRTENT